MGEPDEQSDVMAGGKQPAGEDRDVMAPGSQVREDVLRRGQEPADEDSDLLDGRER